MLKMNNMKKSLSFVALLSMLALGQGAFAWTYDGIGSLNPFTNFGRGFGGNDCACQKVQNPCCEQQKTTCGKRHLTFGQPAGYAVPIYVPTECGQNAVPIIYDEQCPCNIPLMPRDNCNNCQRRY